MDNIYYEDIPIIEQYYHPIYDTKIKPVVIDRGLLIPTLRPEDNKLYYLLIEKDIIKELADLIKDYDDGK